MNQSQPDVQPDDSATRKRKAPLAQTDVPSYSVDEALKVARAIADEYGKRPSTPIDVAKALKQGPNSGPFRVLAGAAAAYGFTEGGAFAERIALTELGRKAVAPTSEGEDLEAKREALMRPRVMREFLTKYTGSKWPRTDIAQNVLEQMGVPREQTERASVLIHEGATSLGFITTINAVEWVQIPSSDGTPAHMPVASDNGDAQEPLETVAPPPDVPIPSLRGERVANRKVFITHGKNRVIVEQLKKLLAFGEFEPVVAVEESTTAKPLPDKVLDAMRSCTAAIVHVGAEKTVTDAAGVELQMLNPNVLVEIGAAMALYGRRFILLVEKGVTLPSNLQGLYEVRYTGQGLDHESTMALLEAFNGFKAPAANL